MTGGPAPLFGTRAALLPLLFALFAGTVLVAPLAAPVSAAGQPQDEPAKRDKKQLRREFLQLKQRFEDERTMSPIDRSEAIQALAALRFGPATKLLLDDLASKESPVVKEIIIRALGESPTATATSWLLTRGFTDIRERSWSVIGQALSALEDAESIDWLVKSGYKAVPSLSPKAQLVFLDVLSRVQDARVADAARKLLAHRKIRPDGQTLLVRIARNRKDSKAVGKLARLYRWDDKDLLVEILYAIRDLRAEDQSPLFHKALESKYWEVQSVALDILGATRNPELIDLFIPKLRAPHPGIQIAAVQAIKQIGGEKVIAPLIDALEVTEGRVKDDIVDALMWLTGTDMGLDSISWRAWWKENQGKVKIQAISREEFERLIAEQSKGDTGTYYGLRVISNFVCFVIDVSGSMEEMYKVRERSGESGKGEGEEGGHTGVGGAGDSGKGKGKGKGKWVERKKIEVAKGELRGALRSLKDGVHFNIIKFSAFCKPWQVELVPKDDEMLDAALRYTDSLAPGGTTNVYDTLVTALSDPKVNTLYFLSDGAPTAGSIEDPEQILAKIAELNKVRKVKIHTIGFKLDPKAEELMRTLAEQNYGTFVKR